MDSASLYRKATLWAAISGTVVSLGVFLVWAGTSPARINGSLRSTPIPNPRATTLGFSGTSLDYHGYFVFLLALLAVITSASLNTVGFDRARGRPGRSIVSVAAFGLATAIVAIDVGLWGMEFPYPLGDDTTLQREPGIYLTLLGVIAGTCCALAAHMMTRRRAKGGWHITASRLAALFGTVLVLSVFLPWELVTERLADGRRATRPLGWWASAGLLIFLPALIGCMTSLALGAAHPRRVRSKTGCSIVPITCFVLAAVIMMVEVGSSTVSGDDNYELQRTCWPYLALGSAVLATACAVITLLQIRRGRTLIRARTESPGRAVSP